MARPAGGKARRQCRVWSLKEIWWNAPRKIGTQHVWHMCSGYPAGRISVHANMLGLRQKVQIRTGIEPSPADHHPRRHDAFDASRRASSCAAGGSPRAPDLASRRRRTRQRRPPANASSMSFSRWPVELQPLAKRQGRVPAVSTPSDRPSVRPPLRTKWRGSPQIPPECRK
jgi:hypothetical protein